MKQKRITIYDIAKALNIHATYVSRALNGHVSINKDMVETVRSKAKELGYRHNSFAANLRRGRSNILGVIVPKIKDSFFSNVISGVEEICAKNGHHIIICQSNENFQQELEAVDTLIKQNVDGILISLSAETKTNTHLLDILNNRISLIQFDRYDESVPGYIVENNNREAAHAAVTHLLEQGYGRIAYIGGPDHLKVYNERKKGYLQALENAGISVPSSYISNSTLYRDEAYKLARGLLQQKKRPDCFFTTSDYAALGVLQAAQHLGINVPSELGIMGFQNEEYSQFMVPGISSVDQRSEDMGRKVAEIYFEHILPGNEREPAFTREMIRCDIVRRDSTKRKT